MSHPLFFTTLLKRLSLFFFFLEMVEQYEKGKQQFDDNDLAVNVLIGDPYALLS